MTNRTLRNARVEIDKIYNEDCIAGMQRLPKNAIDMVLTDIPYGEVNRKSGGLRNLDKGVADVCNVDLEVLCAEIARVCKGSVYVFCGTKQFSTIIELLEQHGFSVRTGVWNKTNPSPANGQYLWRSGLELCVYGKKAGATFNRHCENAIWTYGRGGSKLHPTQKPVKLFEYLIESSSNLGDTILDAFIGSGTTAEACITTGRHYIGFELDRDYYKTACERIAKHTAKMAGV